MTGDTFVSAVWGDPTRWSLVVRASAGSPSNESDHAWRELVRRYREPVLRAMSHRLGNRSEGELATDDFFTYLYEKNILPRADRSQGRFRCYLQGVIGNYARHWKRSQSPGASEIETVDVPGAEQAHEFELEEELAWAEAVLRNSIERLRRTSPRDAEIFFRLHSIAPYLPASREDLCSEKGLNANALSQAVFRARRDLREMVLAEIREMCATQADFEEEQGFLLERLLVAHPGLIVQTRESGASE